MSRGWTTGIPAHVTSFHTLLYKYPKAGNSFTILNWHTLEFRFKKKNNTIYYKKKLDTNDLEYLFYISRWGF